MIIIICIWHSCMWTNMLLAYQWIGGTYKYRFHIIFLFHILLIGNPHLFAVNLFCDRTNVQKNFYQHSYYGINCLDYTCSENNLDGELSNMLVAFRKTQTLVMYMQTEWYRRWIRIIVNSDACYFVPPQDQLRIVFGFIFISFILLKFLGFENRV